MMLAFQIAWRFLKSSIGQTILIVLGISVGVSVQVFIGSLIGGLQASLVDQTIGSSSQITIREEDKNAFTNYETLRDSLQYEELSGTTIALTTGGNVITDTKTSQAVIKGYELNTADELYGYTDRIVDGRLPSADYEVLVGVTIFEDLGLDLGDSITVAIPLQDDQVVTVVGIIDFNIAALNESWMISTLETAQLLTNLDNYITTIEMQLEDVFTAEDISLLIAEELREDLVVTNWIEENGELLTGLSAQSSSSLMIQVFVTISVVLGITSVLAITVIQKSRQIGILKAMGIPDRIASHIFMYQGLILGFFGAIGGVLLGLVLTAMFTNFAVDDTGNPVVPLLLDPGFIALSALVALFSATVASVIPARRSRKLSVIDVIKNG